MGTQLVPTVDAVKEYHRKNSPPWQVDVPYNLNDVVFGSDGNIYKCIQAHNLVDPYDDPKDPTLEANQDVYWEQTGGGAGTSISEYDVDFEVQDSDRTVIAIAEDGEISVATKKNYDVESEVIQGNTPVNYDARYAITSGHAYADESPIVLADRTNNLLFQAKINSTETIYEGVRSAFDGTSEVVLPFAAPRPSQIKVGDNNYATIGGHVLVQDDTDSLFYVLKSSVSNWAAVTNLNSQSEFADNNNVIHMFGAFNLFFVAVYSTTVGLPWSIYVYDPSDDSVSSVTNTSFLQDLGYTAKFVSDGTNVYYGGYDSVNGQVQVIEIVPSTLAVTSYTHTGPTIAASFLGIKEGIAYFAEGQATASDPGTPYAFDLVGATYTAAGSVGSFPYMSEWDTVAWPMDPYFMFYDSASDYFYAHDNSVSMKLQRTTDFTTWEDVVLPTFPTTDFRVIYNNAGGAVIATNFASKSGTAGSDTDLNIMTIGLNLPEVLNRYKALGITSGSKASIVGGKISKITVQKIAVLDGFTGLTSGAPIFMGDEGAITQDINDIGLQQWRVLLGYAVSTTEIDIQLSEPILNNVGELLSDSVPIGTQLTTSADIIPTGCVEANGQAILRSSYPTLNEIYSTAGYPYGNGDGTTTFNVPDYSPDSNSEIIVIKARYVSGTSVEENAQIDSRLSTVETDLDTLQTTVADLEVGTGTPGIDYTNSQVEDNVTDYVLYDDGAVSEPVDGTGGTATVVSKILDTSTPLIGAGSLQIDKSAADGQGEGVGKTFTIDRAWAGSKIEIRFNYETALNYASGDVGIYVYDVTNATIIKPSIVDIPSTYGSPSEFLATFISSSSLSYRLIWHTQTTSALTWTLRMDNIQPSAKTNVVGAAISPWYEYSMTISAPATDPTLGTTTQNKAEWSQVGKQMLFKYVLNQTGAGTAGSGTYLYSLPDGYSIDTNSDPIGTVIGHGKLSTNADLTSTSTTNVLVIVRDSTHVHLQTGYEATKLVNVGSSHFNLGSAPYYLSFTGAVTVEQFSSNINMVLNHTEYASNSSSTDADDTTSFVYGIQGAAGIIGVTALTDSRVKRIEYKYPAQPDDVYDFMISPPGSNVFLKYFSISGFPINNGYAYVNASGGVCLEYVDTYHIDVRFFNYPYGNTTVEWSNAVYTGCKWFVRKSKGQHPGEVAPVVHALFKHHPITTAATAPLWNTIVEDTHSGYNSSNGVYTIPISGVYAIHASFANGGTADNIILDINASEQYALGMLTSSNVYGAGSIQIRLQKGDEIQIQSTTVALISESLTNLSITYIGS